MVDYNKFPAKGLPGQRVDDSYGYSKTYTNQSEIIPFGRLVAKVVGEENGIKLPNTSTDKILGGVLRADALALYGEYQLNEAIAVLRQGATIYIENEDAITPDDAIYVRYKGKKQTQTITFDAVLVTGNVVNLKIDGTAMPAVTFTTDHATTMQAIANQILASFAQIATCTEAGNVLTLTSANNGQSIVISDVIVTGGASQAVASITETVTPIADSERGKIRTDDDNGTAFLVSNYEAVDNADANSVAGVFIKY